MSERADLSPPMADAGGTPPLLEVPFQGSKFLLRSKLFEFAIHPIFLRAFAALRETLFTTRHR